MNRRQRAFSSITVREETGYTRPGTRTNDTHQAHFAFR